MDPTTEVSAAFVADKVLEIRSRFDQIVELVPAGTPIGAGSAIGSEIGSPFQIEEAQDLSDRFRLWSGNIGASHPPTSKLSLEARLGDVVEVLSGVLGLLDEIIEAADDLLDILSGRRENREFVSSEAPSNALGIGDEDGDYQGGPTTSEARDMLDIMSECVSSLFRISVLIQQATPRDRFVKALQDRRDPFNEQFDINHVQERYPKLASQDKKWLVERLGRAITSRRQFIRYCREHRERLEQPDHKKILDQAQSSQPVLLTSMGNFPGGDQQNPNNDTLPRSDQPRYGDMIDPTAPTLWTRPSTKASTLDPARVRAAMAEPQAIDDADDADDGKTYSSAASSIGLDEGQSRLELPTLADVSQGNREFECILCCGIKKFTRGRAWRRHAYHDLKAYVCTLGEGECGLEMFGDQKAWFDHELKQHRRQWTCAVCKYGPYRSLDTLKAHAGARHPEVDGTQLRTLIDVSQAPLAAIPAQDCPFCDEWEQKLRQTLPQFNSSGQGLGPDVVVTVDPRQFRRHVGTHLQQLALFAVPRTIYASDEQGNGSVTGNARLHSKSSREPLSSHSNLSFRSASRPESPDPHVNSTPRTAGDVGNSASTSAFPKVTGEMIAPSDEEKWEIFWNARNTVLHSNNVAMQMNWARDVLIWNETAQQVAERRWKREGGYERPVTPPNEQTLRNDALNIISFLAAQNHPEACYQKGKMAEFGKFGSEKSTIEAQKLYQLSSDEGYVRARYRLGLIHEKMNDTDAAMFEYNAGADLKDAGCTYKLGMVYLLGQHGVAKDLRRGIEVILQSAETSDEDVPEGAYIYGMLLANQMPDITVPANILAPNEELGLQWIMKAAYLGFVKAQLKLGQVYELRQMGCDFEPALSVHYYHLAARQGNPEASLAVSRWFLYGHEGTLRENYRLAFEFATDAAATGLSYAEFVMGYYYEIGIHVSKNLQMARHWYELSAEHGCDDATRRLATLNVS
ncbi:hypothetical protein B0T14DRAFT_528535 [Immersiella caudata]|uniref:Oxidoreductase acuF-like C2H2 type zinc-finger domain-containing protein n=1 Tax=Immersiella caudata TaxID=314043 RepID=A0AA40BUS4_9PEZI|nr:hypothetical protein B0T14DRAFT_528535 [Immersiella caudata]